VKFLQGHFSRNLAGEVKATLMLTMRKAKLNNSTISIRWISGGLWKPETVWKSRRNAYDVTSRNEEKSRNEGQPSPVHLNPLTRGHPSQCGLTPDASRTILVDGIIRHSGPRPPERFKVEGCNATGEPSARSARAWEVPANLVRRNLGPSAGIVKLQQLDRGRTFFSWGRRHAKTRHPKARGPEHCLLHGRR
jgi:hypothetical protein